MISDWGIKKFNLDELYARFFRLAEKRIVKTGVGIVAFISSSSWLSDASFVELRRHLLESFDRFWVENLHGDRTITEYAPDGRTSETVFAIPGFSPGIRQGVATSLWVKTGADRPARVLFRDDLSEARAGERRAHMLETLNTEDFAAKYVESTPLRSNRFSFWPMNVSPDYLRWPHVTDLCAIPPLNGLMEKRGGALIDIDKHKLEERMQVYFDKNLTWEQYKVTGLPLVKEQAGFKPSAARTKALAIKTNSDSGVFSYLARPFDNRYCYYTPVNPIWNRARPELRAQCWSGNQFILTRFSASKSPEGPPWFLSKGLFDDHLLSPDAVAFPLRLRESGEEKSSIPNLSSTASDYLSQISVTDDGEALLWMHTLAIGYSPLHLRENEDGIRNDWPRIPLPHSPELLGASAELGRAIASLLDSETDVAGVTAGAIRPEFARIATVTRADGGQLNPGSGELRLEAGWGHRGKDNAVMPGTGKVIERAYEQSELEALRAGAEQRGIDLGNALALLGETTCDIWLNGVGYWKNVPRNIWKYTIGGYQVIKKWLSYREYGILGRSLTDDEVHEVTSTARRLAAIILRAPDLDANYTQVKAALYDWPATRQG